MTTKRTARKRSSGSIQSPDVRLIADQREANEQLVRALVQLQEINDAATAAQERTKRLLGQMIESENELLATVQMREQLLGMVGHDLRNPLCAVSMCVEFLARRGDLGQEATERLHLIQKSLHRMDRLILQLYDFTRVRMGGGLPLNLRPCDLRSACHSAIEELSVTTETPIRQELHGDLTGRWDEERLVGVLSNLIGNAIDHCAEQTAVLVRGHREGDQVVVEVVNQGEPIPLALLPVLFDAFHRGIPEFKARPGHLGLGLYIAHEIVQAHGGTLGARSADGTTTFSLRLPRSGSELPTA